MNLLEKISTKISNYFNSDRILIKTSEIKNNQEFNIYEALKMLMEEINFDIGLYEYIADTLPVSVNKLKAIYCVE